ncbi:MAG: hypothetical protein IPM54_15685 [Polyangiaceae bacterium]|nr:hypothetical protein [Polyangiaceae bacterium]
MVPHDPILEVFDRAPVGEPYTPEQRAELDRAVADIAAGKVVPISHEEVHAWVASRARSMLDYS